MSSIAAGETLDRVVLDADIRFTSGTPIGVDVGRRKPLVLAPATDDPEIEEVHEVDVDHLEDYYQVLTHRRASGFEKDHTDAALADRLQALVEDAAAEALAYAETFEMPVLVLEDLDYSERSLDAATASGASPDCWFFPAVHEQLTEHARGVGIPVVKTSPKYTTQQCHLCGELAQVHRGEVHCTTDTCPAESVCRDRSAAATIANRVL